MPCLALSLAFLVLTKVMAMQSIIPFFFTYLSFGAAFIPVIYLLSHIFDEIETATKWVGLLTLLFLLIIPVGLACLFGLINVSATVSYGERISNIIGYLALFDPVVCFAIGCWNLACSHKIVQIEELKIKLFNRAEPLESYTYILIMIVQSIVLISISVVFDNWVQQRYRKKKGKDGNLPPQLEVHDDVVKHADEVHNN